MVTAPASPRSPSSVALLVAATVLIPRPLATPLFWGDAGHRMIGELAAETLPAQMPAFFRDAKMQLSYLNPEPDRWRDRAERTADLALDEMAAPEHFIDLEMLPADRATGILHAPSRLAFADSLRALGMSATKVGELPFRIIELTQLLRVDFRQWRAATDPVIRAFIEQRIINDAGILGHYVADGSNPAHTTIQFNGWTGPNPKGYATDPQFHSRFESAFVQAQVTAADVRALSGAPPRVMTDLRASVIDYLRQSNAQTEPLYTIDKQAAFNANTTNPANKRFAAERLAAGVTMLRDIWWTAWTTSDK